MTKNETSKLDYFIDVVTRQYCRAAEENDMLYEEMEDLKVTIAQLLIENADYRWQLEKLGVVLPVTEFTPEENEENLFHS